MTFIKKKKVIKNEKREALELEVSQINGAISAFRVASMDVPKDLLDRLNRIQSILHPNKYNAVKVDYNGVKYDSTLEANFAKFLDAHNIPFEVHKKIILQEGFRLNTNFITENSKPGVGEAIQAITYEADFVLADFRIIVDVKGNSATETEEFKIKFKMLKNKYRETKRYLLIRKQSEFHMVLPLLAHFGLLK